MSTTLEIEAIATLENEATQTDWLGDLDGSVWIGPAGAGGIRPITVTYQGLVADTYNFNASDSTYGKFEQLARDGWAADFRVTGQTGIYTASQSPNSFSTSSLGMPIP